MSDAAHIITNVEAKWPGSVHDSTLSNRLYRGEIDGFLLGDRGYPCRPTPITPYPEPGPQQRFNVAHCRMRARVELTLGLLKARFQCLRYLRVTSERACDIIVTCGVLHNIAIIRGEQHPALQIQDRGGPHQPCRFPVSSQINTHDILHHNQPQNKKEMNKHKITIYLVFFISYKFKNS
ncbi:putative nuclease HARBI1 [Xyrauchen texanus]|uniref:putative nuclease HARBI1 n=1 Tax=Xyrauchen texanus TaxID=154827 RepID=UPI002241871A|nr:putative nuclease HARBI1 [Xyrauchen texanus]